MRHLVRAILLAIALFIGLAVQADDVHRDLAYGEHALQTLDLYVPDGDGPHPFILYIHGGGWWNGSKANVSQKDVAFFIDRSIAFAAIDYRTLPEAAKAGLDPPLLGPLLDSARALQFLRLKAGDYGLDPAKAAVYGASSGGFNALWLGLRPDQADLASADPVARMSTLVTVAGAIDAQTSIDPAQMRDWVGPGLRYGGHAFGLAEDDFETFLTRRRDFAHLFAQLSPAAMVHPAAPPVHLLYTANKAPDAMEHLDFVHSPAFGTGFMAMALRAGLQASLTIAGRDGSLPRKAYLSQLAGMLSPQ